MNKVSQTAENVKQNFTPTLLPVIIIPIPLTPAETARVSRAYAATFLPPKKEAQ